MADANVPLVARIMVQHGTPSGGAGSSSTKYSKRQADDTKSIRQSSQETSKSSGKGLFKMVALLSGVGLIFGFVYKLFRNSQVTKSIFGSLFQILGAMVDVFLAPFVPYIIPVLHALADKVDDVGAFAEEMALLWKAKLGPWFKELKDYIVAGDFVGAIGHVFNGIGTLMYKALQEVPILKDIASYLLTAAKLLGAMYTFTVTDKVSGGALNPASGAIAAAASGLALAATWTEADTKNLGRAIGGAIQIHNSVNVDKDGNLQETTEQNRVDAIFGGLPVSREVDNFLDSWRFTGFFRNKGKE